MSAGELMPPEAMMAAPVPDELRPPVTDAQLAINRAQAAITAFSGGGHAFTYVADKSTHINTTHPYADGRARGVERGVFVVRHSFTS